MTRRTETLERTRASGKTGLLHPLPAGRTLTGGVIARIAAEIRSGRLQPGARLPTEQDLMAAMGISRTVVREAVSALRAEGLLTARQGSGVFVATDTSRVPYRIDPEGLSSIEDVLEIMELRLALEVEMAALAAERVTSQRLTRVQEALGAIDAAIDKGQGAINEDFGFHRTIAEASGNARFVELLEFLGRHLIPRQSIRLSLTTPDEQRRYLRRIQKEHREIYQALKIGNAARARKTMRAHLARSLRRYKVLAERQSEKNER